MSKAMLKSAAQRLYGRGDDPRDVVDSAPAQVSYDGYSSNLPPPPTLSPYDYPPGPTAYEPVEPPYPKMRPAALPPYEYLDERADAMRAPPPRRIPAPERERVPPYYPEDMVIPGVQHADGTFEPHQLYARRTPGSEPPTSGAYPPREGPVREPPMSGAYLPREGPVREPPMSGAYPPREGPVREPPMSGAYPPREGPVLEPPVRGPYPSREVPVREPPVRGPYPSREVPVREPPVRGPYPSREEPISEPYAPGEGPMHGPGGPLFDGPMDGGPRTVLVEEPAPHGGSRSVLVEEPAPHVVNLAVPVCCEACGERVTNYLEGTEGVDAVECDVQEQTVTVVGDIAPADALQRCRKCFKKSVLI